MNGPEDGVRLTNPLVMLTTLMSVARFAFAAFVGHKALSPELISEGRTQVFSLMAFLLTIAWGMFEKRMLLAKTPPGANVAASGGAGQSPGTPGFGAGADWPRVLALFVTGALVLGLVQGGVGGCAEKIGARVDSPSGMSAVDPSNTNSTTMLRDNAGSVVSGKLSVETSEITEERMQETNAGGAAKQRLAFRWPMLIQGARDTMQAQLSAASNLRIEGVEAQLNDDGSPKLLKIALITTDNAEVQRSVNAAVSAEVEAFMRGTDADKEVQLKRLDAQVQMAGFGADVAKAAIPLIKLLAGSP